MLWKDVKRSTEEEFQAFRRMLNNLYITPEKLTRFIEEEVAKNKSKEEKKEK